MSLTIPKQVLAGAQLTRIGVYRSIGVEKQRSAQRGFSDTAMPVNKHLPARRVQSPRDVFESFGAAAQRTPVPELRWMATKPCAWQCQNLPRQGLIWVAEHLGQRTLISTPHEFARES